jgi:immune inhibitor A
VTVPADKPTLTARVSYSIEDDYDYAYAQVSTDGGQSWTNVDTNLSTAADPNQQNEGHGITGCSGTRDATSGACDNAWTDLTADLTAYAGQDVKLRFKMFNDAGYHELGFSVDSIKLGDTLVSDFEGDNSGWTLNGFRVMDGSSYTTEFTQYYLAENRQYRGYDKTLAEGPYSYDYSVTAPNKVDQFPYQDGLLVWYANGLYADNNTSGHPSGGEALPVDANGKYNFWMQNGVRRAYASGRLNSYDATFDVDQTDALHLTNESNGGMTYDVASHPSIPVFDDSNVNAYWDGTSARTGWYSTKVAGVGTMIQVLSSDESTGRMVIKAGQRFVAATSAAAISGEPKVGQTLVATAPSYFQTDATPTYLWAVDGSPAGAGSAYQVTPADAGKTVTVTITGSKPGYLPATDTATVNVALQDAPKATSAPAITGTPRVGQPLTVTPASWPTDGTSTFSWTAGDKEVGTGTTYTPQPADAGKTLTVTETHKASGYQPGTATSEPTAAVQPGSQQATSAPQVTGTPRVGQQLTAKPASWPVDGTSTFSWTVGKKEVGTGTTYTLRPADAGKTVTVTETHTATGYEAGTATSSPTAKVLPCAVKMGVKAPKKVAKGTKAPISVTVSTDGMTPTGKVRVLVDGRAVSATSLSDGTVTVRLPKMHTGAHKVVVKYLPGTGFSRASKTFTIRVTK